MRRYIIPFWIHLVLLSVSNFVLAAPVAARETLEVRSYVVDVLENDIASWKKRMDDEDRWSTNEAYLKDGDNPQGNDAHADDAPGDDDEDMFGWESEWDSEEMGSDGRGPDPHYNNPPEEDSANNNPLEVEPEHADQWSTNEAYLKYENQGGDSGLVDAPGDRNEAGMMGSGPGWDSEQMRSDGRGPDPYYNNPQDKEKDILKDGGDNFDDKHVGTKNDGNGGGGYDNDAAVQSEQASAENPPPIPGPESEHPATPEHMTFFEKLLKDSPRPRNSRQKRCCREPSTPSRTSLTPLSLFKQLKSQIL